jgi:hypothetical protein
MTTELVEQGPYVTSVPQIRNKFPVFIRNRKIHYRVQSNPPPAPVSGQQSAIHTLPSNIFIIQFNNITHHQRPYLPSGLFSSGPPQSYIFRPVCHACHMPRSSDVLDLIIAVISGKGENHKAMQYAIFSNLLSLPPSGSKHFQRHPVLLSRTLSLCSLPAV